MMNPSETSMVGGHRSWGRALSRLRSGYLGFFVTVIALSSSWACAYWYSQQAGADTAPDSLLGLGHAMVGTLCIVFAGVHSLLCRRKRTHAIGGLHRALHWHICPAFLGFGLLLVHASGNLNLRSGTYALYGLTALVVSGSSAVALIASYLGS
jgi:hypothetical protein